VLPFTNKQVIILFVVVLHHVFRNLCSSINLFSVPVKVHYHKSPIFDHLLNFSSVFLKNSVKYRYVCFFSNSKKMFI
jgi:hypothetical protein